MQLQDKCGEGQLVFNIKIVFFLQELLAQLISQAILGLLEPAGVLEHFEVWINPDCKQDKELSSH